MMEFFNHQKGRGWPANDGEEDNDHQNKDEVGQV